MQVTETSIADGTRQYESFRILHHIAVRAILDRGEVPTTEAVRRELDRMKQEQA